MISLDCETTGIDLHHGASPFFVTTCTDEGDVKFYEWEVDPVSRRVDVPPEDVREIRDTLDTAASWSRWDDEEVRERHCLILQNAKFDASALRTIGVEDFPWPAVRDTLLAGHLLASNQPHDLTSMVLHYLGVDIEPLEKALKECVLECRRFIKGNFPDWRTANKDLPEMPSAKETTWRYDYWLPRAVALACGYAYPDEDCEHVWDRDGKCGECGGHVYWTVLRDYANSDSEATVLLWQEMKKLLHGRGLWKIYLERLKCLPVAFRMEQRGVTVSKARLDEVKKEYEQDSAKSARLCVGVAKSLGYDLSLPRGANNKSLLTFCFDVLRLPVVRETDKGNPSLDKSAMDEYESVLPKNSKALTFVRALKRKRKRDTAISYLEGYARFLKPLFPPLGQPAEDRRAWTGWYKLHPSINPTGTDTLRWSHSNPNTANISRQETDCPACRGEGCDSCDGTGKDLLSLRRCFGPAPGREWWSLDAKNIELRIPAYISGEADLIALFEKPDEPPFYGSQHLLNFSTVYPEIWADALTRMGEKEAGKWVSKIKYKTTYYQWCKNGDFALQYNCGREKADATFRRRGAYDALKSKFAKQEALNQKCIKFAEVHGYVETVPDKTVDPTRGYPLLCTRTEYGKILSTVPLSYFVQGTAMQWTNKAMVRVDEFFEYLNAGGTFAGRAWPGGYYIALQVHDELVPDVPSGKERGENPWDYNLPVMSEVRRLMALGGEDIGVPTPCGMEYHGTDWSTGVTL